MPQVVVVVARLFGGHSSKESEAATDTGMAASHNGMSRCVQDTPLLMVSSRSLHLSRLAADHSSAPAGGEKNVEKQRHQRARTCTRKVML